MTYRDRRAARAERLRAWADKRTADATRTLESQPELRHDWAFITQPGHIPERARMNARDDRAYASLDKAASMSARADSIEAAADRAIYSDDPDAVDKLAERIAGLEAERERIVRYNASARAAHKADSAQHVGDLSILDNRQRADLTGLARIGFMRPDGAFPPYVTSNLSGNISKQRDRLAALRNPRPTWFHASRRDAEVCYKCDYGKADHTPHATVPTILMCPPRDSDR